MPEGHAPDECSNKEMPSLLQQFPDILSKHVTPWGVDNQCHWQLRNSLHQGREDRGEGIDAHKMNGWMRVHQYHLQTLKVIILALPDRSGLLLEHQPQAFLDLRFTPSVEVGLVETIPDAHDMVDKLMSFPCWAKVTLSFSDFTLASDQHQGLTPVALWKTQTLVAALGMSTGDIRVLAFDLRDEPL